MGRKKHGCDFWEAVAIKGPDECWNWQGAVTSRGYGCVRVDNKTVGAHRRAYEVSKGPIADGMVICHQCDNKLCCNPAHLWLGTHLDNAMDYNDKGKRKLRAEDIPGIRQLFREGMNKSAIGRRYGITETAVRQIIKGQRWAHVEETA